MKRILDIGCGTDITPGVARLDMNPAVNPDILLEIKRGVEIPVGSDFFDEIRLKDILEHVDDVPWLLSEAHRIGSPNAEVYIRYPHFSSVNNYGDVTHSRMMNLRCLEHFDPTTEYGAKYKYYGYFGRNFKFKIEEIKAIFSDSKIGRISNKIYSMTGPERYERRLALFLPIENVEVKMRVLK
jgi:hypothetical protein